MSRALQPQAVALGHGARCTCASAARRAPLIGPGKGELAAAHADADAVAGHELSLQDLLGERILDLLLDRALERSRPVHRIEARLAEKVPCCIVQREVHAALLQALAQVDELDVDD